MKIIIAGAGKIGYAIAAALSGEGHDLTVIDKNPQAINKMSNELDLICIEGSATDSETLREAGAEEDSAIRRVESVRSISTPSGLQL